MNGKKNSFYNWKTFPKKTFKIRQKIAIDIIHDFLLASDTFHHMNMVVNVTEKKDNVFWGVDSNFIGINKLFFFWMIDNEQHKEILTDLIYQMAVDGLGNKDFVKRAVAIEKAVRMKVLELG